MSHLQIILACLAVGAVLHLLNAAAGAMLPPLPGQERTRYGYWYRLVQKLASNGDRLEAALPAIARELAAEAQACRGEAQPCREVATLPGAHVWAEHDEFHHPNESGDPHHDEAVEETVEETR